MKKLLLISLLLLSCRAFAQVGVQFPEIKGMNLLDSTVSIPGDLKGKYSIIGIAYSEKSQQDLQTWFDPIDENFLWDEDVNTYFIAVVNTLTATNLGKVKSQAREYLLPELHKLAVFTIQNMSKAEMALKISDQSKPYFFVIGPDGKVVYATSGRYAETKLDQMIAIIDAGLPEE